MSDRFTSTHILNAVWAACDTFRGAVDPANYKNYVLTMLFLKYLSDVTHERTAELSKKYGGDKARVARALRNEPFQVPRECDFQHLYEKRDADNIGELINIALDKLEDENKAKLENVFGNVDYNSEAELGRTRERNDRLKHLLEDFNRIDLRPSHLSGQDTIGDAYEFLIERFAAQAGKKAGEFYTPPAVSRLVAALVKPKPGMTIYDPACGSGSLLIRVSQAIKPQRGTEAHDFHLYGQESNGSTWALCKMNMFLHQVASATVERGDTLRAPRFVAGEKTLKKFDIVVANPPFSLDKWGQEKAQADPFNRFFRGVPPKSRGDFAFITHMVESAVDGTGKVAVIVPHGVLFRGAAEGRIRQALIEENLLDAVIGLAPNLFYGTGIPVAILVFDKGRPKKKTDVLFIDASRDFEAGTNQNKLLPAHMARILSAYDRYVEQPKFSHVATREELADNGHNLNIPRYVDTFEEEQPINLAAVKKEITIIEKELEKVRAEMKRQIQELGI
ncbi:MAG: type I restriction-modification system subunit M [Phycisphaerae bacterium]|nr:type I restriction-modification system subunit M [Phycisphaerae bacterium]